MSHPVRDLLKSAMLRLDIQKKEFEDGAAYVAKLVSDVHTRMESIEQWCQGVDQWISSLEKPQS